MNRSATPQAGLLQISQANAQGCCGSGRHGKFIFIKIRRGCKRKFVARCAVAFFWNAQKIFVHFVIVVGIMKNSNGIHTGRNAFKQCFRKLFLHRCFDTLHGRAATAKSSGRTKQANLAKTTVVADIGNLGHDPALRPQQRRK